jgi:hypothetical protein
MFPPLQKIIQDFVKSDIDIGQNPNTQTGRSQLKRESLSITMPFLVVFISSLRAQGTWSQMLLSKKESRFFSRR